MRMAVRRNMISWKKSAMDNTHTHTHIYIYTYIHTHSELCVSVHFEKCLLSQLETLLLYAVGLSGACNVVHVYQDIGR